MKEQHHSTFVVTADHPSLPGHFPGTPVVAGVIVLDLVLKAAESWQGRPVQPRGIKNVKFHSPLLPGETAAVFLEKDEATLNFRVTKGEHPVAQGAFTVEPA